MMSFIRAEYWTLIENILGRRFLLDRKKFSVAGWKLFIELYNSKLCVMFNLSTFYRKTLKTYPPSSFLLIQKIYRGFL